MMTDYKIRRQVQTGESIETTMDIYEGDITTVKEINPVNHKLEDITRYRRTAKIGSKTFTTSMDADKKKATSEAVEILDADKTRTPIDEQKKAG